MRLRTSGGQHTAEFSLLIGMTALIAVAMQPMLRKAMSRGLQAATDVVLKPVFMMATPEVIDIDTSRGETGSTTLRWSVPDVGATCTASGSWAADDPNPPTNWSGYKLYRGEETIENIKGKTTFYLTCSWLGHDWNTPPAVAQVTVTVGSLHVNATQAVDMQGRITTGFQTTQADSISGTAVNQDIQTRQLPEE